MNLSDTSIRRLSVVTAFWGIVFAGFHFYWAAGGSTAMDERALTLGESLYIAFIAVLGLAGAAVAHGLYQPWGARIGHRRLRTLARLGDDGADGVVITAYFLLGGLLFSALGWHDRWSGRSA